MIDINEKIDEYFYPQSKILREFGVPEKLYEYDVLDFRNYIWCRNRDLNNICFAQNISKDNIALISNFTRNIVKLEDYDFCRGNLVMVLIDDIFKKPGRYFVIVRIDRELEFKNGKFERKYEEELL